MGSGETFLICCSSLRYRYERGLQCHPVPVFLFPLVVEKHGSFLPTPCSNFTLCGSWGAENLLSSLNNLPLIFISANFWHTSVLRLLCGRRRVSALGKMREICMELRIALKPREVQVRSSHSSPVRWKIYHLEPSLMAHYILEE
ncbi:hypothetical protein KP509_21G001700 [Ceratopteris richardii]|uniref:Uncharacterized protein n=1 Tax=Ceratopteris richardii TaxID=49495 RepID=A0A8T2S6Y1_CERRI|nr:hypothetical protein KP509_21G001700 [Ceratopteris richardii]